LSGKVLSIKAVETNGYRLQPPTPLIPPSSFLLNTQVTLIGSQQSADNQQHDFDDRPFFFSLSSIRLAAVSFDRRGPDCAKMAEDVIALLLFFFSDERF
jgi:hypothetical protein